MKHSKKLPTVLVCWVLAGCVTSGAGERVYTPPAETPFNKTMKAVGDAARAGDLAEAERQAIAGMALSSPSDLGNDIYGIPFNRLASLYLEQRKYAQAGALYRQAILFLGTLGPFDKRAKDAVFNISWLASSFLSSGRKKEAGELDRRLLEYTENALGAVHIQVSHRLNHLGWWHERAARFGEAEKLYKRALAILEELRGLEHPDLIYTLHWLTRLSRKQRRAAEAGAFQARALAIREREDRLNPLAGRGLPEAGRLTESGRNMRRGGRYVESEFQFIRALKIRKKLLGSEHPDVIRSQSDLAAVYRLEGRFGESERLYLNAKDAAERSLGAGHPVFALLLDNLAVLYLTQNRYGEAEPLIKRSLAIFEKLRGPVHADVATVLNNLAWLYTSQKNYAEAETVFNRSLSMAENLYGPNHPKVGNTLGNLGLLYYKQGRYPAAEQKFKRGLAMLEKLQVNETVLAVIRHNLARLYIDLKRYGEAEPLLDSTLAVLERTVGPTHQFLSEALTQYVRLLRATGRGAEAEKIDARLKGCLPERGVSLWNLVNRDGGSFRAELSDEEAVPSNFGECCHESKKLGT